LGGLDVGERSPSLHQIANPISNDGHHVAILDDIMHIAEATVPGTTIVPASRVDGVEGTANPRAD
jgi:hypothetical protein